MSEPERVTIRRLPSGVPGLDDVLGGGIPEYSFNMIAGAPGTGKTTLAEQIMFANATRERPALHFTVLGEPALKMLRYQQQFRFFDPARVGSDVQFLNLSEEVLGRELDAVLERIVREVERINPGIVVVDSFRTVIQTTDAPHGEMALQHFVQRLALRLTSWEATTFLLGEYGHNETRSAVFTVADSIIWLENEVERNSTVRKLRVTKVRGQAALSGLHTFRITDAGVQVYPRQPRRMEPHARSRALHRLSTGVPDLDQMMGGGIPSGDSLLVTGPTGSGKTVLASQFIAAGVRNGERGVIAVSEENPQAYTDRAGSLGIDLAGMQERGEVDLMYMRPLDLSVDETLDEIRQRVRRLGAKRVAIDSFSGFEIALAPAFRQDFREAFYRLLEALTALDITVLSTVEVTESTDYLRFSPYNVSFLADDIIAMRYTELDGALRKVLAVIKMRSSEHSQDLRSFDVRSDGLHLGNTLHTYRGIITGVPTPRTDLEIAGDRRLTPAESRILDALLQRGQLTADEAAHEAGLTIEESNAVLVGLVAARYVRRGDKDGQTVYRATSRLIK